MLFFSSVQFSPEVRGKIVDPVPKAVNESQRQSQSRLFDRLPFRRASVQVFLNLSEQIAQAMQFGFILVRHSTFWFRHFVITSTGVC
jgi:hypothetical protein